MANPTSKVNLVINGVTTQLDIHDANAVDLNSNQTVAGVKTFSNGLSASLNTHGDIATLTDLSINSTNEDANGMPLTGHTNSVKIKGSQFNVVPCMLTGQLFTNGDTSAELLTYKYKDISSDNCRATFQLRYSYANNTGAVFFSNIGSIVPGKTNTTILGSPSLQWNNTYTRKILIDNDINIASSLISKTSNSGNFSIRGGLNNQDGASISVYGKDYNGAIAGNIYMTAYGNSDYTNFRIYPNGTISVYNNSTATTKNVAMQEDVIPRSGGAVMTGSGIGRIDDTDLLYLTGGTSASNGGNIVLLGASSTWADIRGVVRLTPTSSATNYKDMYLYPSGTWTWNGTACQIISDQRLKQQISNIDDKLLDAWKDVELCQFKYNDAVDQKKDKARLHTGYVVQQIDSACKSHGVDISEYGLYCHEEYPQETEEVEVEQKDGTKTKETRIIREASEHYSLRYTEVYAVECMYLRRCIARLTARIEELEKGNNIK